MTGSTISCAYLPALAALGDSGTCRHKFVGSLGHTSEDETGLVCLHRARGVGGKCIRMQPRRGGLQVAACGAQVVPQHRTLGIVLPHIGFDVPVEDIALDHRSIGAA